MLTQWRPLPEPDRTDCYSIVNDRIDPLLQLLLTDRMSRVPFQEEYASVPHSSTHLTSTSEMFPLRDQAAEA
jgi:hypothetical protein